jgi:hypothetical protein
MDDFGTIIYIIFTILAIVFSILKKSNQAKPTEERTDEHDPFEEPIPSFEKIFGMEKKEEPKPVQKIETSKQNQETVQSFKEKKKLVDTSIQQRNNLADHKKRKEKEADLQKEKGSWFNAREAIIYSEILKRPEF